MLSKIVRGFMMKMLMKLNDVLSYLTPWSNISPFLCRQPTRMDTTKIPMHGSLE